MQIMDVACDLDFLVCIKHDANNRGVFYTSGQQVGDKVAYQGECLSLEYRTKNSSNTVFVSLSTIFFIILDCLILNFLLVKLTFLFL